MEAGAGNAQKPGIAACFGVEEACRETARHGLNILLPDGVVPITKGFLVPTRKDFVVPITKDTVERTAKQGWVVRAVEAEEQAALQQARAEVQAEDELVAFITATRALPNDGFGGWYECDVSRRITADELAKVVTLARRHPDDLRAQETACQVLTKAASIPVQLDENAKAHSARSAVACGDGSTGGGLVTIVEAMRRHRNAMRLQCQASQALWHLTDNAEGARAAQASAAVEVLSSAMLRFPLEKALQWAACGALANIAKRYEAPQPDAFLAQAAGPVASLMANFPKEAALQELACSFLWQLATRDPAAIAETPGLKGLVEHAATSSGVRQAKLLLECVSWRTRAEALPSRGGGRRRWGQWATGRRVAA